MTSTATTHWVLTFVCEDKPGIVHAISGAIVAVNGNITESHQYTSLDTGRFFMRQAQKLMAEHGLTVADLGGKGTKAPSASAGRKVAPKYKNAATGETWTGRGLQPKWVQAALASGKKIEDFTI